MNDIIKAAPEANLIPDNLGLEELFARAQCYGIVSMFQMDDTKRFIVNITFKTAAHIELKASSGYKCTSIQDALRNAITNAEQVRKSIK